MTKLNAQRCPACDGCRTVTGHYRGDCRSPNCRGPMFVACPKCSGEPCQINDFGHHFVGDCSPKAAGGDR